jgi:ribonucleoside-triphosphate reductase
VTKRKIKTEVFSRVSGYFRPVQNWNKGKKEEFRERKFVDIKALQMDKRDQA